ncbi:hypothetical protein [Ureibacillus acetophenoni]
MFSLKITITKSEISLEKALHNENVRKSLSRTEEK